MKPRPISPVPRVALTREEAAQSIGVSVSTFTRHVQPELRVIRRGSAVLIPVRELERWAEATSQRTLRDVGS